MQAFSLGSETPMCFVAVGEEQFGQLVGCNAAFNRAMRLDFGRPARIDDFLVPEMRASHQQKMRDFIKGDAFSLEHRNGFTLSLAGKLVYAKILVQLMPSIVEGLRYVFFLKKLMPRRKVLGLKNGQAIGYSSQSFDDAFEGRARRELLLRALQDGLASLRQQEEAKVDFEGREVFVRHLHEFSDGEASWLFVELYEQEDVLLETKYNTGERTKDHSNFKRTADSRANRKDSVISRDSGELEKSNMEKSDLQEKLAAEKLKKTEEAVKLAYEIVVDDRKKRITNRILAFTIIIVLLLLAVLIAAILVKLSNQDTYLNTLSINTAFNKFLMTVSRAIFFAKLLNFYQLNNNAFMANVFLNYLANSVNITSTMDQLVVNFEIGAIT